MNRVRELEAIRGVWVVLILAFHATQASIFFGWSRVDLFFVLSGYLATRRLIDSNHRPTKLVDNLARRLLRLLPAYYLLLLLVSILDTTRPKVGVSANLLAAVTLTQNVPLYWSGSSWLYSHRYLAHTWTLAIELQFFLLLSVLYRFLGTVALIPFAALLLANSVLLRAYGLHPWTFLGRGDGHAIGMLLALALSLSWRQSNPRLMRFGLVVVGLMGLGYLGWFLSRSVPAPESFDRPLGLPESLAVLAMDLAYAGLIGLIVEFANHPALRPLRIKGFSHLGDLSYGIYLYGFIAIDLSRAILSGFPNLWSGWAILLAFALAIAAAEISRALVEQPLLRLGRRPNPQLADYRASMIGSDS